MDEREIRVSQSSSWFGYDLYAFRRDGGRIFLTTQVQVTEKEAEPGISQEPTIRLSDAQAQQLINELWKAGLRPNNGEGSGQHTEALKYHLEDMRRLVFNAPVHQT